MFSTVAVFVAMSPVPTLPNRMVELWGLVKMTLGLTEEAVTCKYRVCSVLKEPYNITCTFKRSVVGCACCG